MEVTRNKDRRKTLKPERKDYFRENPFILKFDSDTTFSLNTSVNFAKGNIRLKAREILVLSLIVKAPVLGQWTQRARTQSKSSLCFQRSNEIYSCG